MVKTVKKVQYLKGEIVPSDARLVLKLITSHQVYEMAMNFDEFKQYETSIQVKRGVIFLIILVFLFRDRFVNRAIILFFYRLIYSKVARLR